MAMTDRLSNPCGYSDLSNKYRAGIGRPVKMQQQKMGGLYKTKHVMQSWKEYRGSGGTVRKTMMFWYKSFTFVNAPPYHDEDIIALMKTPGYSYTFRNFIAINFALV